MSTVPSSRIVLSAAIIGAIATAFACSSDPVSSNGEINGLEYVTPEEVGFSSAALDEARDYFDQIGSAAVIALYENK
ncbi:MAG: hypothetical protein JSW46_09555, partial [Gemmatimonadota bacterium]